MSDLFLGLLGAIELAILSDYYGREIAAYDIQTTRCDLYGQVSAVSSVSDLGSFFWTTLREIFLLIVDCSFF